MADPITMGVIGGVLESILAGQAAEKEVEKKRAEKAAARSETAHENLMASLTDPVSAFNFVIAKDVDPAIGSIFNSLSLVEQSTVYNYASRDLPVPDREQKILSNINTAGEARSFMGNKELFSNFSPTTKAIITARASQPIGTVEKDILSFSGTREETIRHFESFTGLYPQDSPFGRVLRSKISGLMSIPKDPVAYEPLNLTQIESQLKAAQGEDADPGAMKGVLSQIALAKSRIAPFIFDPKAKTSEEKGDDVPYMKGADPKAVNDHIVLTMMQKAYAQSAGSGDADVDFTSLLDQALKQLEDLKDTGPGAARLEASGAAAIKSLTDLGFKPENATPEQIIAFTQLQQYAQDFEDVDNDTTTFGTTNPLKLDKPFDNPLQSLMNMDRRSDLGEIYKNLDAKEQGEFEALVKQLMILDNQQTRTATTRQGGTTEQRPQTNFIDVLPRMYQELPFVRKFIHENLQYAKPGELSSGVQTVSVPQLEDDGVTPLGTDFFRVNDSLVIEANETVKAIAKSQGKTPQNLFLTDGIAYGMIDNGSQDPLRLFEAAKGYQDAGLFTRTDTDLRTSQHATLAMVPVSRGITDRRDQLSLIAMNMSSDLPKQYQPEFGTVGITPEQYTAFIQTATGRSIDLEDIGQSKNNSENFLNTADEVEFYLANRLPPGSRAYDELAAFLLNVFKVEDSFFKQVATGVMRTVKTVIDPDSETLFREQDMFVEEGQSASDVRKSIIAMSEKFMDNNFLGVNAQLNAALVTLAYNYAKTMDPSGRISERDFSAALEAVSAGRFDTRETQIATVRRLISQAQDNVIFHGMMFDVASSVRGGSRTYQLSKDNIRNIRALRYFDPLKRVTRGMNTVRSHTDVVERAGSGYIQDKAWQSMFAIDDSAAATEFGDIAVDNGISVLKMRVGRDTLSHPMGSGVPVYFFKDSGKVLTPRQIRTFQEMSRAI